MGKRISTSRKRQTCRIVQPWVEACALLSDILVVYLANFTSGFQFWKMSH